jgi:hypothetical protein
VAYVKLNARARDFCAGSERARSFTIHARALCRRDDDDQAPRKRGLTGLLDAVQASGGKVVNLSQRKLARQIGLSRRTIERALGELAAAGALVMDAGRLGTRLALA